MRYFVLYKNVWIDKVDICNSHKLPEEECKQLLKKGGLIVRNTYNWDTQGPTSFWYVIKDQFGGIEELPTKVRNQVRKSLKTYLFRIVTYDEMLHYGCDLFNKSRERFAGNSLKITEKQWERRISGNNLEFWMGFDRETGNPASFAINSLFHDYCDYSTMGISPDFPNNTYPMYGLIYEMNRYYLERRRVPFVCDGSRSITEHSNIQSVLEGKFRFRKAYCELQVMYKPWIGTVVRFLFPFRHLLRATKIAPLLRQEAWARGMDF